jgi:hypothetical protein
MMTSSLVTMIARRAQAVAVERRADLAAIGKGDAAGPSHGSISAA